MATKTFTIRDQSALKPVMLSCYRMVEKGLAAGLVVVTLGREKRSLDQNAKLWPMLTDVSEQVEWYGQFLSKEDWKDILSAAWKKQKAVPGIEGGFVVLGIRTREMSKEEFSELIELIYAFGAEHKVVWSERAKEAYQQYRGTE